MKFFQKPGVAVVFTIVMIAAALFIGLSRCSKVTNRLRQRR